MLLGEDVFFCFLLEETQIIILKIWYLFWFSSFIVPPSSFLIYPFHYQFNYYPTQISEVYSKELKGAISALASLQGHLLIASGPKIILHKWNGTELNGVAFFDVPPLYVVSLNTVRIIHYISVLLIHNKWSRFGFCKVSYVLPINVIQVKNFILLGDIHKSIYFLSWKEQGAQLNLLAKDFGALDCLATEFLIDGSTLSLMVSDEQKNIQVSTFHL